MYGYDSDNTCNVSNTDSYLCAYNKIWSENEKKAKEKKEAENNNQDDDNIFKVSGSNMSFPSMNNFMGLDFNNSNSFNSDVTSSSDAVNKAMTQVGQVGGYKYGESGKWCAAFASWAYGGQNAPWGDKHDVAGIKSWAQSKGVYKPGTSTVGVKSGDLVVWRPETCGGKSHVGIVTSVNSDGSFSTVEGNSGNKVRNCNYKAGTRVDGFVSVGMNKSC